MTAERFKCYLVTRDHSGKVSAGIAEKSLDDLPEGEVLVRVAYSSLNYKDALAAEGHPGVARVFPHVPGVDLAGVVASSGVYEWVEGDRVLATGFDLGASRWGGYAEYTRVPQDWIVPLPEGLTLRESMILGTAGFTAGLCVDALQKHDVSPENGEIVVTGASGGVGSMAVAILAKLGYHVAAVTGKETAHEYLQGLGAERILDRGEVDDRSGRPMLHGRWAGAVDTVGGNILTTILRSTRHDGCVAACGLTAGDGLTMTVYPFILRGLSLAGIDAAWGPVPLRHEIWRRLAGPWKPRRLERMAQRTDLSGLPEKIREIRAGKITGRVVVEIGGEPHGRSPMHEIFEHTADLGLRIRADDLDGLFAEAARAMFSAIVTNLGQVHPRQTVSLQLEGDRHDELLRDWLGELLYAFHADHMLFCEFEVRLTDTGLTATARGESIDTGRHEIDAELKAVTYHGLKLQREGEGWLAEVIVDI
ncbi:MAG: archease [Pirellulales bacterium]|nr:archease [Pirellulales bacterium]